MIVSLLCAALLTGCGCQHEWVEADCTTARTCSKCDAVEGEALGHAWVEATCAAPRSCSVCAETEGEALPHTWEAATCAAPKTCTVCAATEGEALAHTWAGTANFQDPDTCTACGAAGEPLTAYFAEHGLACNVELDKEYDYVTCGYMDTSVEIMGKLTATNARVFASDDKHKAKDGYEYRAVDVTIDFVGQDVYDYGILTTCTRADYYTNTELVVAEDKPIRYSVNYHGTEYSDCVATFENAGFTYEESIDGMRFRAQCVFLVPAGYDGTVLAFYKGSLEIEEIGLHEIEDENMLIYRLA